MSAKRFILCVSCASALVLAVGCKTSPSASNAADGGGSDSGPKKSSDAGAHARDASKPDAASADVKHDAGEARADAAPWDSAVAALADSGSERVETDAGTAPAPLEIIGRWHSNWGGDEVVTASSWTSYGTTAIIDYDNVHSWLITQNAANASYNPSQFSKIVWTKPSGGSFYYCIVDFGLATAAAARASTKTADASDPATSGCGGYSWTKLSTPIVLEGDWTDGATPPATTTITSDAWGALTIKSYDSGTAITQTSATPPTFSEVVFTQPASGSFYFCIVSTNETSATNAKSHAGAADAQNKTTGCLGAAWTKLNAK